MSPYANRRYGLEPAEGAGCQSTIESLSLKAAEQRASLLLGRNAILALRDAVLAHWHQLLHRPIHRRALPQDQNLSVGEILEEAPEHQHEAQCRAFVPLYDHEPLEALKAAYERLPFGGRQVRKRLQAGSP